MLTCHDDGFFSLGNDDVSRSAAICLRKARNYLRSFLSVSWRDVMLLSVGICLIFIAEDEIGVFKSKLDVVEVEVNNESS